MKLAEIQNGVVANIIAVSPTSVPRFAQGWPELAEGAQIGWRYEDGEFFEAEEQVLSSTLSPARFAWLLARTGLEGVWTALEAATSESDADTYALLRAQRHRSAYSLAGVLKMVADVREVAQQIAPDVDLSDGAIKAAWRAAEEVQL